jgi:hypothetical protein
VANAMGLIYHLQLAVFGYVNAKFMDQKLRDEQESSPIASAGSKEYLHQI